MLQQQSLTIYTSLDGGGVSRFMGLLSGILEGRHPDPFDKFTLMLNHLEFQIST